MDAIILTAPLRTILTVTTVWNTVDSGDMHGQYQVNCVIQQNISSFRTLVKYNFGTLDSVLV